MDLGTIDFIDEATCASLRIPRPVVAFLLSRETWSGKTGLAAVGSCPDISIVASGRQMPWCFHFFLRSLLLPFPVSRA